MSDELYKIWRDILSEFKVYIFMVMTLILIPPKQKSIRKNARKFCYATLLKSHVGIGDLQ